MSWTDAFEALILDHILGGPDYARIATVYVGLSTTTPADDGSNFTEPGAGAYERKAVTNNGTNFPAASGGAKSNGAAITFIQATGSWGTVTHFGLFTAASGGVPFMTGALTASKTIDSGDTPSFATGDMDFTLD